MMTYDQAAKRLEVPWCDGGCGLSITRHKTGCIDPFGVIHFTNRKPTKRGYARFLTLVARMDREADGEYLNRIDLYDWFYCYIDSVNAARMAKQLGFRLPASIFEREREMVRLLAAHRGVKLTKYRKVWSWAHDR